ncbi:transposase [mine drainage metagenome]
MSSMLMIVELILAIFLERTTKKNSANSSIPPSQTDKDNSSLTDPGSKGKGKKADGETVKNRRTIETLTIVPVDYCDKCGADLRQVGCTHERRTKIDIIFEKVVEHVEVEIKQCPSCERVIKGKFPVDMPGPLQYGLGVQAFIINLLACQMVALKRAQALVYSIIDVVIAEATMLQFILRLHAALENWEVRATEKLLLEAVMHVDKTSLRVDKTNYWIHVHSAGGITLKKLHRKRGIKAMEENDIIPRYMGKLIHDCWASYFSYSNCGHGLCGSHLLRELTFVVETNRYRWARRMKRLLQATYKRVSDCEKKCLDDREYARLLKCYRKILELGTLEMPAIPDKPAGKRGRIAKSDAHNLLERLQKHEASVLLFARDPLVPFTNNRGERDLRMSKVKQKVSGCFRSEIYAHAYCRITSYLQTMAYKGVNPMIAIQMALAGELGGE